MFYMQFVLHSFPDDENQSKCPEKYVLLNPSLCPILFFSLSFLQEHSSKTEMYLYNGFPCGSDSKRIYLQCERPGFDLWVWKIHWRRKWQPTSVFVPGKSHGQRTRTRYNPWGCKESNTPE